ncbi:MAG: hypothetical protein K2M17_02195 [Bacilli bacterium]|nr:hypothetical protein [Bacilli bacterium]
MALTKTDLEDIERLIATSSTICQIAKELWKLEVKGQYGTEKYQEKLDNLMYWLDLEAGMFTNIANDYDKNKEYIDFLIQKMEYPPETNKSKFVINSNPFIVSSDLALNRLYNRFVEQSLKNKERAFSEIFVLPPDVSLEDIENTPMYKKMYYQMLAINYVAGDLINLTVTLSNQEVKEDSLASVFVIWHKYYFSLLLPEVEKAFLATKFAINPHPYMMANTCKRIAGLSDEEAQIMNDNILMSFFTEIITEVAKYTDAELRSICITQIFNYRIFELRARLILVSDKTRKRIQDIVTKILEQIPDEGHELGKKQINEAFEYFERDKTIPQVVSFGL